eukprot:6073-Heterococcus_DN1.PRE.2
MNALEFKEGDDYWDFEMTTESAMAVSGLQGALREPYPVKPKFGSKLWSVFVFEATAFLAAQEPVTPMASGHDAMGAEAHEAAFQGKGNGDAPSVHDDDASHHSATVYAMAGVSAAVVTAVNAYEAALQAAWLKRDLFFFHLLVKCLKGTNKGFTKICRNQGQRVWYALAEKYNSNRDSRVSMLLKAFDLIRQTAEETLADYLLRLQFKAAKLADLGHEPSMLKFPTSFVDGLREEYHLAAAAASNEASVLRLMNVLTAVEVRREMAKATAPPAAVLPPVVSAFGVQESQRRERSNGYKKKETRICNNCGIKGHLYRDCRKPKKEKGSAVQQQAMAVQAPTVPNATAPVQLTRQQLQQQQPAPDEAHFAFTIKSAVPSKNAVWLCHKKALHAGTTIDGVTVGAAPFGTFNYRARPVVPTTTMAPYAGEPLKVVSMIMDTGATWSVVDPEKLGGALTTDKVTVSALLIVPGGGRVIAKEMGTVHCYLDMCNGALKSMSFSEVLLVPGLGMNLLSASRLCGPGMGNEYHMAAAGSCFVHNGYRIYLDIVEGLPCLPVHVPQLTVDSVTTGDTPLEPLADVDADVKDGSEVDGIVPVGVDDGVDEALHVVVSSSGGNVVSLVPGTFGVSQLAAVRRQRISADLFHRRMGHLNVRDMAILKNAPESGIYDTGAMSKCHICPLGKSVHQSHPVAASTRATERLELVHLDTLGPISPTSHHGFSATRHANTAIDALQKYITSVAVPNALHLRQLRTDGAGEFASADFKDYLDRCGIVHSTLRHTHNSNC